MTSTATDNAGQISPSRSGTIVSSWANEEECILRECLYVLQGISGERIRFRGDNDDDATNNEIEGSSYNTVALTQKEQAVVTIHSKALPHVKTGTPRSCSVFIPPSLCYQSKLGSGALDAINICAEAGWLYRRLQRHLDRTRRHFNDKDDEKTTTLTTSNITTTTTGSIQRAFASALQLELQSYQQFLARQHNTQPATITTLRHLLVAIQAPVHRLTILAAITDAMSHLPGPDLLHALHMAATRHGDTRHQIIAETLLAQASRPWLDRLYLWTTEGVLLDDPAREFFVQLKTTTKSASTTTKKGSSSSDDDCRLWTDRYRLDDSKVPQGILERNLIEPAFMIGKGINFIRKCLLDGEWTLELTTTTATTTTTTTEDKDRNQHMIMGTAGTKNADRKHKRQEQLGFVYTKHRVGSQQCSTIHRTLLEATSLVHSHILTSLHEKHCLMHHLFALKQFLLLGQGDFFSALMDGIYSEYENKRGIVGIYRHSLAAIVETALRNTNASGFPPDIVGRLEVELLLDADDDVRYQFGPRSDSAEDDPRTVWDIFALEYRVPDPVLSIVHPKAVKQYKDMFLFLFGLRKIEFLLNLTWRQSAVLQHALQTTAQHNGLDVSNSPEYVKSLVLLRQVAMTRQAMMHFVVNFKSYLMFEVLEGGWKGLRRDMQASETLDEAIQSHDEYLEGICRTSLHAVIDPSSTSSQESLSDHVKDLLNLTDKFCSYQHQLFGQAIEAAERAAEKRRLAEHRLEEGQWGFSSEKERDEEGSFFGLSDEEKMAELDELSNGFNDRAVEFLRVLDFTLNGGPVVEESTPGTPSNDDAMDDMKVFDDKGDTGALRFLAFQLDCNKFYSPGRSSNG